MQRTKGIKPVDYILCADIHLREDTPVSYVGDFQADQWEALDFVAALQRKYDCPVLHSGDLFHHWKPSPWLLSNTIERIPDQFITVFGNHDLPQHNLELMDKSGVYMLATAGMLSTINSSLVETRSWGQIPKETHKILLWHVFNYKGKSPWPGCTAPTALDLLKQYPSYDLIVTGDNHQTFVEEYEGRLLVNPGSLQRQSAAQIDHHPCVFLYHAADNSVTRVDLPFKADAISREHLQKVEQRENRLSAFISKLEGTVDTTKPFEENLTQYCDVNHVSETVTNIITKSLEK